MEIEQFENIILKLDELLNEFDEQEIVTDLHNLKLAYEEKLEQLQAKQENDVWDNDDKTREREYRELQGF